MADALAGLISSAAERTKLISAGRVALATRYITPDQKWSGQLASIESGAGLAPGHR